MSKVVPSENKEIAFENPVTGKRHILMIQECETQQMKCLRDENMEYPEHFVCMTYTVEPELAGRDFMLRDCNNGDNPRMKKSKEGIQLRMSLKQIGF